MSELLLQEELPLRPGERESRLIYSCIVAGKSANFTDGVMTRLHKVCQRFRQPGLFKLFDFLEDQGTLEDILKECRTGNYGKLTQCFTEIGKADREGKLDLLTCTPQRLEEFHGIGPKTSRFFILWTRPGERYAALDVHVLRWMSSLGYMCPKNTPSGPEYLKLEECFLCEADKRGVTPRQLDHDIWLAGSKYTGEIQAKP